MKHMYIQLSLSLYYCSSSYRVRERSIGSQQFEDISVKNTNGSRCIGDKGEREGEKEREWVGGGGGIAIHRRGKGSLNVHVHVQVHATNNLKLI